jgi:hypothetical protein
VSHEYRGFWDRSASGAVPPTAKKGQQNRANLKIRDVTKTRRKPCESEDSPLRKAEAETDVNGTGLKTRRYKIGYYETFTTSAASILP